MALSTDDQVNDGGFQSMKVTNDTATLDITGDPNNTWVSFFTKPGLYEDTPADLTDTPAAMCITTGGIVKAWTGAWVEVANDSAFATGWQGFQVHFDWSSKLWDIYHTAADPGGDTIMTKLNDLPLPFDSAAPSNALHKFSVETELATYVDNAGLAVDTADLVAGAPSPSNAATTVYITFYPGAAAESLTRYFTDENNSLGGPLGQALGSGLVASNDMVHIWNSTTAAFDTYKWMGGYWDPQAGATNPAAIKITRTTGMYVETTLATIEAGLTFSAFDGNNPPDPTTIASGWTMLQSPNITDTPVSALGLPGSGYGDLLYVYSSGSYLSLWWDHANTQWKSGPNAATTEVSEGQGMWRYNTGNLHLWTPIP